MATKAGKKGKQGKPGKQPVAMRPTVTVRECMTWHYPNGYEPSNAGSPMPGAGGMDDDQGFYLAKKADIGKAKSRGYGTPPVAHQVVDDDGHVIDALRGWPRHRRPEYSFNDDDAMMQQGGGGEVEGKSSGDPWMGDLVSHKFMNDAVRKRMEEEAAAAEAAAAAAKKANPGPNDIRGNRTQQLRNIALAQKVEVNPKDLWQMSKFKDNARPHLTTVEKKGKQKGKGSAQGSRRGSAMSQNGYGAGNGDPCTCYDYTTNQYDIDRPESQDNKRYDGPVSQEMDTDDFLNMDFGGSKEIYAV